MDFDVIRTGLTNAWESAAAYTPRMLGALVVFCLGWLLAGVLKMVAHRILHVARFDDVVHRAGVPTAGEDSGYDPKGLVAGIVYWTVLLLTFQLAADLLELTALSAALAGLVAYLPHVLVAALVVVVAMAFGNWVAGAIESNTHSAFGASVARWSIYGFGGFAALSQLQIAEPIVNALFYATVATVGATVVVAFGVGGIPVARRMAGRWFGHDTDTEQRAPRAA